MTKSMHLKRWLVQNTWLIGLVHGNPKFYEGQHIRTSDVQKVLRSKDGKLTAITRSGSHYVLGNVVTVPEDCMNRLMARFLVEAI